MALGTLIARCALGLALMAGLTAFGVTFTGLHVRAASAGWFQPAWRGQLAPLPGSSARADSLSLEGEPTQVLRCEDARSAREVFQHYRRRATAASSATRPFVELDHDAQGGVLAWVGPDGRRLGVIVEPRPQGGSRYQLLEGGAPAATGDLELPAGLALPLGCQVVSSVLHPDGSGHALLVAEGGVQDAAAGLRAQLEGHGFQVDTGAARAIAAIQPDTERLTVPFAGGGRRGLLIVARDGSGVRISLSVDAG